MKGTQMEIHGARFCLVVSPSRKKTLHENQNSSNQYFNLLFFLINLMELPEYIFDVDVRVDKNIYTNVSIHLTFSNHKKRRSFFLSLNF